MTGSPSLGATATDQVGLLQTRIARIAQFLALVGVGTGASYHPGLVGQCNPALALGRRSASLNRPVRSAKKARVADMTIVTCSAVATAFGCPCAGCGVTASHG